MARLADQDAGGKTPVLRKLLLATVAKTVFSS
jgi:hypothetical protein